jgi:hypothetical protein
VEETGGLLIFIFLTLVYNFETILVGFVSHSIVRMLKARRDCDQDGGDKEYIQNFGGESS